jgi:aryl sulfotransferase
VGHWSDGESGVMRTIWLASYPKSGNTWLRMLIANLSANDDRPVDINDLAERGSIASARGPFDHLLLIDSSLLTHDEIDNLRPLVYEELARGADDDEYDTPESSSPVRFVKTHDAYTLTPNGGPLLAGSRGADGAVVIVRDPRDLAPSIANYSCTSIDDAITFMNDKSAAFCARPTKLYDQFRQKLTCWSGHIASWLDQGDIPIQLVRYEDLQADTALTLSRVLAFAGRVATDEEITRAVTFSDFAQLQQQELQKGFREAPRSPAGGNFFRRGETGGWRRELNLEQVARIECEHATMMLSLGYALTCKSTVAHLDCGIAT